MTDKYYVELRHRPSVEESITSKHKRFAEVLEQIESPWGYNGDRVPEAPEIGDNLTSVVELQKLSGRGRKSYIVYRRRSAEILRDDSQYDDIAIVEFAPASPNLGGFVETVFPTLIHGFDCYRASVKNRSQSRSDWSTIVELSEVGGRDLDGRDGVYRINEVNYYDRALCSRAFRLEPKEIAARLKGKVERASILNEGVLLVYSSTLLPQDRLVKIDSEIRTLLSVPNQGGAHVV